MSVANVAHHALPDFLSSFHNAVGALDARSANPAPFPLIHARNSSSNSTSSDTVNIFLDSAGGSDLQFAASIVTACEDQTVYALQCTAGTPSPVLGYVQATCGPNAAIATLTEGASTYALSSSISTNYQGTPIQALVAENCVLSGTTAAACTATISASFIGQSTSTSTVESLSGTEYARYNVAITAGASKTASATATCAASNNAASGMSGRTVLLYAVAGAAGVVGLLSC